jgi:ribosomal-protein-alanine N-acetyltransferase
MEYSASMSLRPAVPEDFPQVLEIERESYPEPWTEAHFNQELTRPYSRFLVLTDDETDSVVLGYLVYWLQAEGTSLLNVTLAPKWRGLGLSRILISTMVNEAVREEIPKVILEVRESNAQAIRVYEHFGFKKTHLRKAFYSNGESAQVMELKTSDVTSMLQ